jgi:hypothetical protein
VFTLSSLYLAINFLWRSSADQENKSNFQV